MKDEEQYVGQFVGGFGDLACRRCNMLVTAAPFQSMDLADRILVWAAQPQVHQQPHVLSRQCNAMRSLTGRVSSIPDVRQASTMTRRQEGGTSVQGLHSFDALVDILIGLRVFLGVLWFRTLHWLGQHKHAAGRAFGHTRCTKVLHLRA